MADIKKVDWDALVRGASRIASAANEMQNDIKDAFTRIEHMSQAWNGKGYDNFVEGVSRSFTGLNNLFVTAVSDIPHEIYAKAKSYASVNQSDVTASFSEQTPIVLTEITKTNKSTEFKFISSDVKVAQTNVKSKFESAQSNADKAMSIADSLKSEWDSISGGENLYDLKAALKKIKNILTNISNALDASISSAETEYTAKETVAKGMEKAADVAESVGDAASDALKSVDDKRRQMAADWRSFWS